MNKRDNNKKSTVKPKSKSQSKDKVEDNITGEIVEIISNLGKIPKERIDLKEHFTAAGLDSFTIIEIIFAIENKFEIDIPQDSLASIQNVAQLVELTKQLIKKRG
ncbi:MAG: acyl carrier protein [Candidatus Omnitrophota bacterium]|jgi:acyl carrier protein